MPNSTSSPAFQKAYSALNSIILTIFAICLMAGILKKYNILVPALGALAVFLVLAVLVKSIECIAIWRKKKK